MKIANILAVAALGLCTVSAKAASFSIALDPATSVDDLTLFKGGTGTATIEVAGYLNGAVGATYEIVGITAGTSHGITGVFTSAGSVALPYVIPSANADADLNLTITVPHSGVTVGSTYTLPTTFQYKENTGTGYGTTHTTSAGNIYVTIGAPEPAQTLAGAMLLGCGGLVFAGRRLFKKQSA